MRNCAGKLSIQEGGKMRLKKQLLKGDEAHHDVLVSQDEDGILIIAESSGDAIYLNPSQVDSLCGFWRYLRCNPD